MTFDLSLNSLATILADIRHSGMPPPGWTLPPVKKRLLILAWHIGNRHIPAEIHKDYILIKRDKVIAKMLKLLGAKVLKKKLSFSPELGAYHKHEAWKNFIIP